MQIVSKSQFKSQVLEYLRKVEQNKTPLIVTHVGKPVVKISPYKENPDKILMLLRGSVLDFEDPLKPVGESDWNTSL